MSARMRRLAVSAGLLWIGLALTPLFAQSPSVETQPVQSRDPCSEPEARKQWEDRSSPVYLDATELAQALNKNGFVVECIRRSKEENLFKGQKGAAWYKTNQGIFVVWFLPRGKNFAALEVIDRREEKGRHTYSFRGTPQIPTTIDSAKEMWFIKHDNLMFEVWGDERLAEALRSAFGER